MANLQELLQKIAEKSGRPLAEVQNEYNQALASITVAMPENRKQQTAVRMINSKLVAGSKSPAVAFDIVIYGNDRAIDLNANKRKEALEAFAQNPQNAVNNKLVTMNPDGSPVVLDTIQKFGNGNDNPNFGKPLQEAWQRKTVVAAKKSGETVWKAGNMVIRGELAKTKPTTSHVLSCRLLGDEKDGEWSLRTSSVTSFKITEVLNAALRDSIADQAFEKRAMLADAIINYQKSMTGKPGFYDRYVIAGGIVEFIKPSSSPETSHMVVVSDPSVNYNIMCWVPYDLADQLSFGKESDVLIIAQPAIGKGWDSEKKVQTDEERLQLNVLGIFGRNGSTTLPA